MPEDLQLFLSFAHQDERLARRLAGELEKVGFGVFFSPQSIPPGADWVDALEANITSSDTVLALVGRHYSNARTQKKELDCALETGKVILPLLIDGAELPFELRRTHWIDLAQGSHQSIREAAKRIQAQLSPKTHPGTQSAPARLRQRYLLSGPLAQFDSSLSPWISEFEGDASLIPQARALLELIASTLDKNAREQYQPHLEHSTRVLDNLRSLCFPGARGASYTQSDFELTGAREFFLGFFAVLLHNLCLLNRLPEPPDDRSHTYVGRALSFFTRTWTLQRTVARAPSSMPDLEDCFHLAIEMYRDSPYWPTRIARRKTIEDYQEQWSRGADRRVLTLSYALRICDAVDVEHRVLADIIFHIFDHFHYVDGMRCYAEHTLLTQPRLQLLLEGNPRLENGVLTIPWASFQPMGAPQEDPVEKSAQLGRRVVRRQLEFILSKILGEARARGIHHANLVLNIKDEEQKCELSDERREHLSWAFFTLAISQEASDTEAATATAMLLPELLRYISASDKDPKAPGVHTKKQTAELLKCMPLLRPNSQSLQKIIAVARAAIADVPAEEYARAVETALSGIHGQGRKRATLSCGVDSCDATVFLIYGASEPCSRWVAELAAAKREGGVTISLHPVHCLRRFHIAAEPEDGFESLAEFKEHRAMIEKVRQALDAKGLQEGSDFVIERTLDYSLLPTWWDELCRRPGGARVEALFGARAFLVEESDRPVACSISTHGARSLALLCKGLGIETRIITWEERLRSPLRTFQSEGFLFSYTAAKSPGAEDECVRLSEITSVTTEEESRTSAQAEEVAIRVLENA